MTQSETFKVGGVRVIPNTDGSTVNAIEFAVKDNLTAIRLRAPDTSPADVDIIVGQIYIGIGLVGLPGDGATIALLGLPRDGTFPIDFAGSVGSVGVNPTATAVYDVQLNGVSIGSISIATSGVLTFTTVGGTDKDFAANDRLTVIAPTPQDATLSDVEFVFFAVRT